MRVFQAELEELAPREKEGVMELTTSWKEEGIQQGLQQGKADLVLRQLNRRVGALGSELAARIRACNEKRLEDLGEALFDFATPADVLAWLDQHEQGQS